MIHPFENDNQVLSIGGLSIENSLDAIEIYGELILRRDADGLSQAKALQEFAQALVAALEQPSIAGADSVVFVPPDRIDNPFA